jgi:hypothetical protein
LPRGCAIARLRIQRQYLFSDPPRLDLHEDGEIGLAGDDVDLAKGRAKAWREIAKGDPCAKPCVFNVP